MKANTYRSVSHNTNVIHAFSFNKILLYRSEQQAQEANLDIKRARVLGHRQLDEHFIECILQKRPQVSVEDATNAQDIALKITKSIKQVRER